MSLTNTNAPRGKGGGGQEYPRIIIIKCFFSDYCAKLGYVGKGDHLSKSRAPPCERARPHTSVKK